MSLLTPTEKAALQEAFDDSVVKTWERNIEVYRDAEKVTVNTSVGDNPLFPGSPNNASIDKSTNKSTIKARVTWGRKLSWSELNSGEGSPKAILKDGEVQIKVRKEHDALFRDAKLGVIDGIEVVPESSVRPHGLFDHNYSTFLFKKAT